MEFNEPLQLTLSPMCADFNYDGIIHDKIAFFFFQIHRVIHWEPFDASNFKYYDEICDSWLCDEIHESLS